MKRLGFLFAPLLFSPVVAQAEETDESKTDIVVYGRAIEQIGIATTASEGVVGYRDFELRPLSRVGELAENVPGLIATQHSGTGKANQFFLRGFNLDHGTDLAAFVDGAPVNMRSHGHGQGYLDLNFLIPEMVERIDFRKGPYSAEAGDFSAAGSMAFTTKKRLDGPIAEITAGSNGYWRALVAGSAQSGGGDLLLALDGTLSNGPWIKDENLEKLNALAKWSDDRFSIGLSAYRATWDSTDQVPERAIASGLIPRLGFIDGDLGGETTRVALNGQFAQGGWQASAYAILYRFNLTSNFTYFLDDPVNGDEFRQSDRRGVFGGSLRYRWSPAEALSIRLGSEVRHDAIGKVGLYDSVDGAISGTIRQDKVRETSAGLFAEVEWKLAETLRLTGGARGDLISYRVTSDTPVNSGKGSDGFFAPKASLAWRAGKGLELYASYGESFHSNDVRGATITVDPATGDPADRVPVFARARGAELGARIETGKLTASMAAFWLRSQSELVFVGDAGTTEPNDGSRRKGVELSLFWKPAPWLTLDGSAALTNARYRGVAPGFGRIPGAVPTVLGGGISAELGKGLTATMRVRHFGSAPLIEDGSVRSDATTLFNLGGYWTRGPLRIGFDVLNLFNARDPDISYFYASRLPGEPADGIEDRHLHPSEPRQVRAMLRYSF